jgi:hypothetical protein
MARIDDSRIRDRGRAFLFVGSCAAVFVILAACAVYAVITLAI